MRSAESSAKALDSALRIAERAIRSVAFFLPRVALWANSNVTPFDIAKWHTGQLGQRWGAAPDPEV